MSLRCASVLVVAVLLFPSIARCAEAPLAASWNQAVRSGDGAWLVWTAPTRDFHRGHFVMCGSWRSFAAPLESQVSELKQTPVGSTAIVARVENGKLQDIDIERPEMPFGAAGLPIRWLGHHGAGESVDLLGSFAVDGPADLREDLIGVAELDDPRAVTALAAVLDSNRPAFDRAAAAEGLATTGVAEAVAILAAAVDSDPSLDVRLAAVEALGDHQSDEASAVIRALTWSDRDGRIRAAAAEVWASSEAMEVNDSLRSKIDAETNADVLEALIDGLGERSGEAATALLSHIATTHAVAGARAMATEVLVAETGKEALPVLRQIFESETDEEVLETAVEALLEMPQDVGRNDAARLVKSHPRPSVRASAARVLAEDPDASTADLLAKVAEKDSDEEVREEAVQALAELPQESSVPVLTRLASEAGPAEVRINAVEALAELAPAQALPILERMAWSDGDEDARSEAVWALAELDDGSGLPMLIKVARTHHDRDLREEAIEALSENDDPRARKALVAMAQ